MKVRFLFVMFAVIALGVLMTGSTYATKSMDFTQCANKSITGQTGACDFIGGIVNQSKSDYSDGMANPQRVMFNNITATTGNVHTLLISWEYSSQGRHEYDFPVSWAQARQLAKLIRGQNMRIGYDASNPTTGQDPCEGLGTGGQHPNDYETCRLTHGYSVPGGPYGISSHSAEGSLPNDPFTSTNCDPGQCGESAKETAFSNIFGPRTFTIWGDQGITINPPTIQHYTNKQ